MPRTDSAVSADWQPGSSIRVLRLRATLLARIRAFFQRRGVLEVDTPLLARSGSTDPALASFRSGYRGPGSAAELPLFLHTSPEFFMKRLLAAGSGPIYQLTHVFRNGEYGRRHNPEFMMLEWYRPGMDHHGLMDELDELMAHCLDGLVDYAPAQRLSYRQWFHAATGLDPGSDSVAAFRGFATQHLASVPESMPDDQLDPWLDLLVTHWLEPRAAGQTLLVYDYPASQAALARLRPGPVTVAERFELYLDGIELANGFHELADADEQQRRFDDENRVRRAAGLEDVPCDQNLLAALRSGLPDCSGVALGFDRLVMVAAGLQDIAEAVPFAWRRV